MKLDITVQDRLLVNTSSNRIPANDTVYLAFTFDPGYGWEDCDDITAVFTKNSDRSYRVGINNGIYYEVPANMLNSAGNIFVSLKGSKNGHQVMSSLTLALVVEYLYLNQTDTIPYPTDDCGNLDRDAYAQYVNTVTTAMNRAEAAAKSVESKAVGWYTKDECDERFAKKTKVSTLVTDRFDTSTLMAGSIPTITVTAEAPIDLDQGTIGSPSAMTSIEAVRITVESPKNSNVYTYGGFKLRKLANICDTLVVDKKGATYNQNVYVIKVADVPGGWDNSTQYRVSLVTSPAIDIANASKVRTNVGSVTAYADYSNIVLTLPAGTSERELRQIEIWYPIADTASSLISLTGMSPIPEDITGITLEKRVNQSYLPINTFEVSAELNVSDYISKFVDINQELIIKVDALEEDLAEANKAVTECAELKTKVNILNNNVNEVKDTIEDSIEAINALDAKIVDNVSSIEALRENDNALSASISNNFSDLKLVKSSIQKLTVDYTELEQTALSHHNKLTAIDTDIELLKANKSVTESSIEAFKTAVNTKVATIEATANTALTNSTVALTKATEAATSVANVNSAIEAASTKAEEANDRSVTAINAANGAAATASTAIAKATETAIALSATNAAVANSGEAISVLNSRVATAETNIATVKTSTDANKAEIEALKPRISTVESALEGIDLATLVNAVATLTTRVNNLNATVRNVADNLGALATTVAALQASHTELEARVDTLEKATGSVPDGYKDSNGNVLVDELGKPLTTTQVIQNIIITQQGHYLEDTPMTLTFLD